MNRDAKIGVVVILIIVGLLVIIWGRGERDDAVVAGASGSRDAGTLTNNLDPTARGDRPPGSGGSAASREPDFFPESTLVLPTTTDPAATTSTSTTATTTTTTTTASNPANHVSGTTASPDGSTWEYTVAAGDVLSTIAQNQLGSVRRTKEIADLNGLQPPYALRIGQKLKMPAKGSAPAATTGSAVLAGTTTGRESREHAEKSETVTKTRRYVVRPEDMGIMDIAERQLGNQSKWKIIADLNQLEKPFALTPGQELLLPE